MAISWSPQQQAGFDWAATGHGSALVTAVAGAGKTTFLVELIRRISRDGYVTALAFNKKAADEIAARLRASGDVDLSTTTVGTFHATGFRQWRKYAPTVRIEGYGPNQAKIYKASRIFQEQKTPREYQGAVRKLVGFAKQYMLRSDDSATAYLELIHRYSLDTEILDPFGNVPRDLDRHVDRMVAITQAHLARSMELAGEIIDYNDMLYAPLMAGVEFWSQDWVLVDECQDANEARLQMVTAMCRSAVSGTNDPAYHATRTVWVGDPAQAVYGFTGADSAVIDKISTRWQTTHLPLTVSYRCPQAVVQEARNWVKHIQPADGAPQGSVTRMSGEQFHTQLKHLEPADAIICRNTRPLVDLALKLLASGTPCVIEGREGGKELMTLATRWKGVRSLRELSNRLLEYNLTTGTRLKERGDDQQAEELADTVAALLAIIQSLPMGSRLPDLEARLTSLFQDTDGMSRPVLTLATGHRSKGREWGRVWWYGRDQLQPAKNAKQAWQKEQELNLMYVMATRAKRDLVVVDLPLDEQKPGGRKI